ncbi:ZIP family metal transporter [Candidatus Gottesmanbacteria bacterium]|nr:ZIP family metal transporter [Candidatus Gottesmanbacteria bacterium]
MSINQIEPIILSLLTFVSTFCGGLFSLKYKNKLHLILGFTSGVILGVVAFDIFPEIINIVNNTHTNPTQPMIALVIGFLVFHVMEKLLLIHHGHEKQYTPHKHPSVGQLSALALSAHSFLDGVGIGLGFQVSAHVGILVALAVLAHDFSDGLNTVSLVILNKNTDKTALFFLLLDALTPILGTISTLIFKIPDDALLIYLGFFAGFLLYIGASDILPEAHSKHSSMKTIILTLLGVLLIYLITRIV